MNIEQEIIEWTESTSYWFKYATYHFLEGIDCTDEFIDKCYLYFLEDEELKDQEEIRDELDFATITAADNLNGIDYLKEIAEIENVNALEENQVIEVSKNLTVIFGENGTGKSGYTRLLNNAFKSRGDKDILSNIFVESSNGQPSCKFKIEENGIEHLVSYPENEDHPMFSQYNVFDSKSGQAHLTQENNLIFTPGGFEYFEKIMKVIEGVKDRLSKDISKHDKQNEFIQNFKIENSIQQFVSKLSHQTTIEELEGISEFKEEHQTEIEVLLLNKKTLQDQNIPKQLEELQKRKTSLIQLGQKIKKYNSKLSKDDYEFYNSLIKLIQELNNSSKQESINQFEEFAIKHLGSAEWKGFIKSAKSYRDLITEEELEKCLLCNQDLGEKEQALFKSYWKLLESQTQIELNKLRQQIKDQTNELQGLQEIQFNDSMVLYKYIQSNKPEQIESLTAIIKVLNNRKESVLLGLEKQKNHIEFVHQDTSISFLNDTIELLNQERQKLIELNPVKKIVEIQNKVNELNDKKLTGQLAPTIKIWLESKKWAEAAKKSLPKLKTNPMTKKQGELFKLNVTNKYKEVFNEECKKLKAPPVVEINQRNSRGTTLRKLQVGGNSVNKILSEGEQKAISLADFFTESQLDLDCKGIILDDPITSLDYRRRDLIAKRLIEEAKVKQVIIFTHNITFLLRLQQYAKNQSVEMTTTTIRRIRDSVGVVKPDLPWIAQKVKDRIGYLKNDLVKLEKLESTGDDPDELTTQIKRWFGLLREGWERSVEERLFKGVIERFGLGIQTQKLKKIEISTELLDEIEAGMTESSNWIHDSAAGLNPTIPTTAEAKEALDRFIEFCNKCKAA